MAAMIVAKVGEISVAVRELSVTEVRNWVAESEAGEVVDPIRAMVFEDCTLDDLARMCDMPADDMEAYGPIGLAELHDKCKAMNPHFFRTREALIRVSRAIESMTLTAASQP